MTKENLEDKIKNAFEDVKRYEYGSVAYRALSKYKDTNTARGSLKQLAKDFGKGDEYEGFIDWTLSSKEGIEHASSVYGGKKFGDAINVISIKELYEKRYDEIIKKYLTKSEDIELIKKEFDEFNDKTYGDVMKKHAQARYKLEDSTGYFSDNDKREAKKTLEKYQNIVQALDLLEDANYERLRPKASERNMEMVFRGYVDGLKRKD